MTVTESKSLKKGTRVYWHGDAADSGVVTWVLQEVATSKRSKKVDRERPIN
jgi:hypothetical protein